MAKQTMLINVHEDETRIALVENGALVDLHVQQTNRERKVGNIYKGRIVKINPAFQAAFVDYGEPRNGFLPLSDVNFNLFRPEDKAKSKARIQSVLKEGQQVMVQILKEGLIGKGAAMTTYVSLPGRYMVMTPNSERSGVSRKVEDPDVRKRLKDTMEALSGGENLGLIIRTAGIDRQLGDLKKDLDILRKQWNGIQAGFKNNKKPGLLHQEASPIERVLRDYFSEEVGEVWVDTPEGYQEALRYFKSTIPSHQKRLKLYVGDQALFAANGIEEQISALESNRIPLPSGGSLVMEATEALVSVDVNSGRSNVGQDIEDTALGTNLEAAEMVARQLRLRNLGGLIVVDFIDMVSPKNRRRVEEAMEKALQNDKARTTVGRISQFGLLELSRQRIDMEHTHGLRTKCDNCGGSGYVPTVNTSANSVLRKIRELAATGRFKEIHGELPIANANYILNERRQALRDLEWEFDIQIKLDVNPEIPAGLQIPLHGVRPDGTEEEDEHEDGVENGESGESRRRRRRRGGRGRNRGRGEAGESMEDMDQYAAGSDSRDEMDEDADEEFSPMYDSETERLPMDTLDDTKDEPRSAGNGSRYSIYDGQGEEEADEDTPQRGPRQRHSRRDVEAGGRSDAPRDARPESRRDSPRDSQRDAKRDAQPDAPRDAKRDAQPDAPRDAKRDARPDSRPAETGGNRTKGEVLFQSQHKVTDPEAVAKLPPAKVRSKPFGEMGAQATESTVIFDSAGAYAVGATLPAANELNPQQLAEKKAEMKKTAKKKPAQKPAREEPAKAEAQAGASEKAPAKGGSKPPAKKDAAKKDASRQDGAKKAPPTKGGAKKTAATKAAKAEAEATAPVKDAPKKAAAKKPAAKAATAKKPAAKKAPAKKPAKAGSEAAAG